MKIVTKVSTITLNIGLKASNNHFREADRGKEMFQTQAELRLLLDYVAEALGFEDIYALGYKVVESNTERTLVFYAVGRFNVGDAKFGIAELADNLNQDCIVVKINGKGYLLGTYAHERGEFNQGYFLEYEA